MYCRISAFWALGAYNYEKKKNKIWKHTNPTRQWENLGQGWFVLNQRQQQQQQEEKQINF